MTAPFPSLGRTTPTFTSPAPHFTIDALRDVAEWDALVGATATASFAHLARWRDVIADACGHESRYCVARDEAGRLAAILPLMQLRSRVLGTHLVSVPFLNYGGPVGDQAARLALVRHATRLAESSRADALVLRNRQAVDGVPVTAGKVTVLLDLAPTADEMWQRRFHARLRTKIKRPMRDCMDTRFGTDQLDAFFEVWSHNMRDLGTPVLPRSFFARMVAAFPSLVLIGVTRCRGRPVAAGLGFLWNREFEMTWSSGLVEFRAAKPTMLLYWHCMRELIGRGVRTFNFGRSTPGTGAHDFKRAWGGVDAPLPWIQWPSRAVTDPRGRAAVRLAAAAWKRLPLAVANRVGPLVSPRLPWW